MAEFAEPVTKGTKAIVDTSMSLPHRHTSLVCLSCRIAYINLSLALVAA